MSKKTKAIIILQILLLILILIGVVIYWAEVLLFVGLIREKKGISEEIAKHQSNYQQCIKEEHTIDDFLTSESYEKTIKQPIYHYATCLAIEKKDRNICNILKSEEGKKYCTDRYADIVNFFLPLFNGQLLNSNICYSVIRVNPDQKNSLGTLEENINFCQSLIGAYQNRDCNKLSGNKNKFEICQSMLNREYDKFFSMIFDVPGINDSEKKFTKETFLKFYEEESGVCRDLYDSAEKEYCLL